MRSVDESSEEDRHFGGHLQDAWASAVPCRRRPRPRAEVNQPEKVSTWLIMIGGALVAAAFAFRGLTGGVLLPAIMLLLGIPALVGGVALVITAKRDKSQ